MRSKIVVALVVVCVIWGSTWLAIKLGLETVPPLLSAGVRFLLASVILYGLMVVRKERIPRTKGFVLLAVFMGLTAFSVPYALVYWGQRIIPSALASILFATYPFFVGLFSYFFLPNENMNWLKFVSLVLGFAGIYIIFSSELSFDSGIAVAGMAAIVVSSFIQAGSLVFLKKYGEAISPVSLNFASMSIGAVLLLIGSVSMETYSTVVWTRQALLSIVFLAVFGNVVAFVSYFWVVKHVETVLLSMTSFVTPIVAVILGALVAHERLSPQIFSGACLVLCGILAANGKDLAKLLANGKSMLWD
jgi:drug/metabolite transporter (DMT)-like permease